MTVSFQNDGLIDMRAVTTFGISSKANDNPIGYFGTGLKYAISIILRHGGSIVIYRGLEPFVFTSKREQVRADEFDIIHMNDAPLGFTTHVGSTWEPWHAFREIYCNTIDEKGISTAVPLQPAEGKTTIVVSRFPAFDECFAKKSAIVLQDKPEWDLGEVEVRKGASNVMYYRGIMAAELEKNAVFCYNVTYPLVLTEDRTIKSPYTALGILCNAILASNNEEFIQQFLQADAASFEHTFDLNRTSGRPGETFMEVAERCIKDVRMPLNVTVIALLSKWKKVDTTLTPVELTFPEQRRIDKAKALLRHLKYDIDKYQVIMVQTLGPNMLGRVMDGKIVLSYRVMMMGDNTLIGTMLEEFLHIDHQFEDMTRDFQNYLMDLIATLALQLHGSKGVAQRSPVAY